ncbi:MAG TPA: type IX secretion system membrane protein PorP/SprF [Chryseolinea sp.]|nr:type IX secretion system membrane protein PorP/SprF [Chryseolinea sp.]
MRLTLLISILILFTISLHAQNDPLYAQYLNNPLLINPAYTGLNNNFNTSITYRKQWAGFEGSPSTANVTAHTSLLNNKMGVGLMLLQDKIGNSNNTEIQGTYAYKIGFDDKYLSFGLQAGILNFRSDNTLINPYDKGDAVFMQNQNITKPSFGAGIILKSDRFLIGLSVPRMLKATGTFLDSASNAFQASLYSQHFYATTAYVFYLTQRVRLKPSILVKAVKGAPVSIDYQTNIILDEKYIAGLYIRNLNSIGALIQFKFTKGYRFGYVYEIPLRNSVGTQFNTHEISLGINLSLFSSHDTFISNF